jgi:hypothetical protein
MKEYIYEEGSWEDITRTIKESLGIECLTSSQAKSIMRLYLASVKVEEMIKLLEGEMK